MHIHVCTACGHVCVCECVIHVRIEEVNECIQFDYEMLIGQNENNNKKCPIKSVV